MHEECGPRFHRLLHTYTVGCLTTLLGEDVSHLRVLCPVRKPITALDCVLLKDRNLSLAPRQGPESSSRACLWVSPRPRVTYGYKYLSLQFSSFCYWKHSHVLSVIRIQCLPLTVGGYPHAH
jgi:hypothetical protein